MLKVIAIFIAFLFILPSYLSGDIKEESKINVSNGNTLYVGGSGPNNYTRIRDAIDNASNGDTIFVYSGVYYENIGIHKMIKLIGEDKNSTIIDGRNKGSVITIFSSHVLIKGFSIRNSKKEVDGVYAGIYIYGNNEKIEDCKIYNNFDGISTWGCENISISNCQIYSNIFVGISVDGYNFRIENCVMKQNEWYGIITSLFSFDVKIKNCDISYSTEKWIGAGIGMGGFFIKVENCKLHDNLNGIDVEWAAFSTIKNCEIYSNNCGICLSFSAFISIKHNIFKDCGSSLFMFSSFFESIHGNNFYSKKIRFMDSAFNFWMRNYWKGWFIPLPKPIFGIIFAFVWNGKLIYIPWIEFDIFPRILPKKINPKIKILEGIYWRK